MDQNQNFLLSCEILDPIGVIPKERQHLLGGEGMMSAIFQKYKGFLKLRPQSGLYGYRGSRGHFTNCNSRSKNMSFFSEKFIMRKNDKNRKIL